MTSFFRSLFLLLFGPHHSFTTASLPFPLFVTFAFRLAASASAAATGVAGARVFAHGQLAKGVRGVFQRPFFALARPQPIFAVFHRHGT